MGLITRASWDNGRLLSCGTLPFSNTGALFLRDDGTWSPVAGASTFGPAGAAHATGLVPDPGAAAHGTPYLLGENATWLKVTGSGVSYSGGTLTFTNSGGTVASVGLAAPAGWAVTGSPVVGSGTLAFSDPLTTQGDLLTVDNTGTQVRLPVGPYRYVLTSDSTFATGLSWEIAPAGLNIVEGRLTPSPGTPIPGPDVTGAGTIYFSPHLGSRILLYNAGLGTWEIFIFAETALALTVTSGKNYDVFAYSNSGTLALELSAAWTDDVTRADALAPQDGVTVKGSNHTRRWLGTVRASGANVVEDSVTKRYVWNRYNQVQRPLTRQVIASHAYTSAAWREWNTSARCEFVSGEVCNALGDLRSYLTAAAGGGVGFALNDTSGPGGANFIQLNNQADVSVQDVFVTRLGYNFLAAVESGAVGTTFDRVVVGLSAAG